MIIKHTKLTLYLLPVLLVSACSLTNEAGAPPHYFGNAVEQNIAAQVVNPDAPENNIAPEHIGRRIAIAQQRYLNDKVEQPAAVKTSSSSQSGGE
ncbi:MAG: hypothetical protein KAJ29_05115 [Alphaproteobacteria bacterium]|nr:hypothetical protein [Alphaproteobacteria bacterium]